MIHTELVRHSMDITIKSRLIGYWRSIINGDNTKIANILHNMHFYEVNNGHNLRLINFIKDTLISVGRIDLFYKSSINNPREIKERIIQTLI